MTEQSKSYSFLNKCTQLLFLVVVLLRTTVTFEFLGENNLVTRALAILCVLLSGYMLFQVFAKKLPFNAPMHWLCLFGIYLVINTLYQHNASPSPLLGRYLDIFLIWGCLETYKKDLRPLLTMMMFVYTICIVTNLFLMIKYPDGFWENENDMGSMTYFFLGGNYNAFGPRMLCALLITWICSRWHKIYLLLYLILIAACVVSLLLSGSKTSLIGVSLFSIYTLVLGSKNLNSNDGSDNKHTNL